MDEQIVAYIDTAGVFELSLRCSSADNVLTKWQVHPTFYFVAQKDESLLKKVQKRLGCGEIVEVPDKYFIQRRLLVSKLDEIEDQLIPFLYSYRQFLYQKGEQFDSFVVCHSLAKRK